MGFRQPGGEKERAWMKIIRLLVVVASLLNLIGCAPYPTLRSYRKQGIGQHIDVTKELVSREGSYASSIGWKETSYKLNNGNWVYVEPDSPHCLIHWEVNPEGIIVGSRVEGRGCDMWPFR